MEPTRGVTASLHAPTYALRWPEHRAYLPLSSGPLRVGQRSFEIHMHVPPGGPLEGTLTVRAHRWDSGGIWHVLFTGSRPREGSQVCLCSAGAPLL